MFGKNGRLNPACARSRVSLSGPPGSQRTDTIDVDVTCALLLPKRTTLQSNDWKAFVSGTETIK